MESNDFLNVALKHLERSNADRRHPFNQVVLGTTNDGQVQQRIVIHRTFLDNRTSIIYTDSASSKVKYIQGNNQASLLFYHPKLKLQLQATVSITIDTTSEFWARAQKNLTVNQHQDYTIFPLPGTPIENEKDISRVDSRFCVLYAHWQRIDLLQLRKEGHLRARYTFENDWKGTWVTP